MNPRRHNLRLAAALLVLALLPMGCGEGTPRDVAAPLSGSTQTYLLDGQLQRPMATQGSRPNVVVVVLDGLRADAALAGAEAGSPMPHLAALARQGFTFAQASAPSPASAPALTGLLTGLRPSAHGIQLDEPRPSGLHPLATWAEILQRSAGYETAAFVGPSWRAAEGTPLEGFGHVEGGVRLSAAPTAVERWAAARRGDQPCFLLVHALEANAPYGRQAVARASVDAWGPGSPDPVAALAPDAPVADVVERALLEPAFHAALYANPLHAALRQSVTRFAWSGLRQPSRPEFPAALHAAYLEGVREIDAQLRMLLDALRRARLLENTLLVVTSTHGTAFGEHGLLLNGCALYDELVRVPLVVVGPPGSPFTGGRVVEGSVGLVDLMPTCLDLLSLPACGGVEGVSLLPLARGEVQGHPVLAEEVRSATRTAGESEATLVSVRDDAWKVIVTYERGSGTVLEEAYDLLRDPDERKNLALADGRVAALPVSAEFCAALERARDQIWGRVEGTKFLVDQGYSAAPYVRTERPPPPCDLPAPR